jgi:KDO2-lipid IV(A) lauroyltransferase
VTFPVRPRFSPTWLGPRYWGTWATLGLLRLGVLLPLHWQLTLGRGVGWILYHALPRRRAIAETNLSLCFPEWSPGERGRVLRDTFDSIGTAFFEVALAWWAPDARVRRLGRVEGLENLTSALSAGRGVILLSGHFTTLELGARLLRLHSLFRPMYRPTKNPAWDWVMLRSRQRHVELALDRRDVRGTLRALRANEAVWYAPDQDYGREHSVFVPFFGVPAATITATSRLAAMSGARVVPFYQHRSPDGEYVATLGEALEGFPGPDLSEDTARITRLLEDEVRRCPGQYLWTHRRFKTRPPGAPRLYPD